MWQEFSVALVKVLAGHLCQCSRHEPALYALYTCHIECHAIVLGANHFRAWCHGMRSTTPCASAFKHSQHTAGCRASCALCDVSLMATAWLQVFSRAGDVKRIIMGLDKHQMTPCGFAFVVYYTRQDAEDAVKYISGTIMDDRPVRVDFDWGFKDGRQYGRGRSGGQVRCLLSRSHIIAVPWCAQAGDHAP